MGAAQSSHIPHGTTAVPAWHAQKAPDARVFEIKKILFIIEKILLPYKAGFDLSWYTCFTCVWYSRREITRCVSCTIRDQQCAEFFLHSLRGSAVPCRRCAASYLQVRFFKTNSNENGGRAFIRLAAKASQLRLRTAASFSHVHTWTSIGKPAASGLMHVRVQMWRQE